MRILKRKLYLQAKYQEEWQQALQLYGVELKKILKTVPNSVVEFERQRIDFHDEPLEFQELRQVSPKKFELELRFRCYTLIFVDVHEQEGWKEAVANEECGLIEEFNHSPHGFELMVMMNQTDCRVVARDLRMYDRLKKSWIINQPPENPFPNKPRRETWRE